MFKNPLQFATTGRRLNPAGGVYPLTRPHPTFTGMKSAGFRFAISTTWA